MKQKERFQKAMLFIIDNIVPFPLLIVMLFLWYEKTRGNIPFVVYIFLLPTIIGYAMPLVGINIFKMWRFNSKWLVGNIYIHHGFLSTPYIVLFFYLCFQEYTSYRFINHGITAILFSIIHTISATFHDYLAVKTGKLILYNKRAQEGKGPGEIINSFHWIGFGLIACLYAVSSLCAYSFFIHHPDSGIPAFILFLVLGIMLMGVVPSLAYIIKKRKR
jgi:hypothetical protein